MRKILCPACLALCACLAVGLAPDTQPATVDPATLQRLVHQLEHPAVRTRNRAARELEEFGEPIVPMLEQAAKTASFEVRARIQSILQAMREPLRGAVIYALTARSQATRQGLEVGDVITHLDGAVVHGTEDFRRLASRLANQRRTLTLSSGRQRRELTFEPGRFGIAVADYDARYGEPLISGLKAFAAEHMPEARTALDQAVNAGMSFQPDDPRELLYVLATYYSGDPAAARTGLDAWAGRSNQDWPWADLCNNLTSYHAGCMHLVLHAERQQASLQLANSDWTCYLGTQLTECGRYPEGIVKALEGGVDPKLLTEFGQGARDYALRSGFRGLGLEPEWRRVTECIDIAKAPPHLLSAAASDAERFGQLDRALTFRRAAFNRATAGRFDASAASEVVRLGLLAGENEATSAFVDQLKPADAAMVLVFVSRTRYLWPEAEPVLTKLTRNALRADKLPYMTAIDALQILSQRQEVDLAELEALAARVQSVAASQPGNFAARGYIHRQLTSAAKRELAMLRGDYAAAEQVIDNSGLDDGTKKLARESVAFFKVHAHELSGEHARWRTALMARALADGGWLLLTRDCQLGYASPDLKTITSIPPPTSRWHPPDGDAIFNNTAGKAGVLTTSGDTVYRLKPDHSGWEPLARLPDASGWWGLANHLSAALDELIPLLQSTQPNPVRIVEPETFPALKPRMVSLLLANGAWLSCDTRKGTVWQPLKLARAALGEPVRIYAILNLRNDYLRAFVYTSRGVLDWRPDEHAMTPIALPGDDAHVPVCTSGEGPILPAGSVRVALLPQYGGTTYVVETATGQVRREGCVNEVCPATFWKLMPEQTRRDLLTKALQAANVQLPWATESAPAD